MFDLRRGAHEGWATVATGLILLPREAQRRFKWDDWPWRSRFGFGILVAVGIAIWVLHRLLTEFRVQPTQRYSPRSSGGGGLGIWALAKFRVRISLSGGPGRASLSAGGEVAEWLKALVC